MITVLSPSPALDVTYLLDEPGVVPGRIHRPLRVLRLAGGKGLNLARAAAALGARVRVVAPLGGQIGRVVAELAGAEGLDLDIVPAGEETRMCVSAIPAEGVPTEFYEPAPAVELSELSARLGTGAGSGDWTVLTGRLPGGGPGAGLLGDAVLPGRVAVDSSGPGLERLLDQAPPDLLKLNAAEAAELLGRKADPRDLADALHARTRGGVVVTAGRDGAVAVDATGAWHALPDPVPGRFPTGSGDSLLAGLLVALQSGEDLPAALRAGSAAGSANARQPGAGILARADYDAALARIEVRPL